MKKLILQRTLSSVLIICAISVLVFLMLHLSGDPIALLAPPGASQELYDLLRAKYGLDQPLVTQYLIFARNAITAGDFGESYYYNRPAMPLVLSRFTATLELTAAAMLISILISFPAGILAAVKWNSWVDNITRFFILLGQAAPPFWVGILLILVFSVQLGMFPPSGREGITSVFLPALTIGAATSAMFTRLIRSSMLDILSADYIRTARAKGLRQSVVLYKHGLRNALIPVITTMGVVFGFLMGGSIVVETVFAWPGLGRLLIHAIHTRDFPVVQAAVFVFAASFVVINFLVDVLYGYIDPRLRYED